MKLKLEFLNKFLDKLKGWKPSLAIFSSIRNKLLVSLIALVMIPLIASIFLGTNLSRSLLMEKSFDNLEAVRTIKSNQVRAWFNEQRSDARVLSASPVVIEAADAFHEAVSKLQPKETTRKGGHEKGLEPIQKLYKGKSVVDRGDGSDYSKAHATWHPVFRRFVRENGYSDLYLVDQDGDVLYSVAKEDFFGVNILSRKYNSTNIFKLFLALRAKDAKQDTTIISDFDFLGDSKTPSAYIASPITSRPTGGKVIGVLVLRVSNDKIATVMGERSGLGQTGETYLVGQDNLFRSESRFTGALKVESAVLNPISPVNTEATKSALEGATDTKVITDYLGKQVLSSWAPLLIQKPTSNNPDGIKWAFVSQIGLDEVQAPIVTALKFAAALFVIISIIAIVIAVALSGGLTGQVRRIMDLFGEIGLGNFEARGQVLSRDELGVMTSSLNTLLDNILPLLQTREERDSMQESVMRLMDEVSGLAEGDLTVRAEVSADITGAIADGFNAMAEQLSVVVRDVKEATLKLSNTTSEVRDNAENMVEKSEEQAVKVSDAMASVGELVSSAQLVADNATQSAAVSNQSTENAREGAKAVEDTNKAMESIRDNVQETARAIKRLGESSQEIGNIVQIIDDISERTSILALNASIQAAMAGDAGRGFAVVAEEVQRLAERSTSSAKQIDTLVKNIQDEINEAGTSMEESIQRVVDGSRLAGDAHKKLQEIENVAENLSGLIQSISNVAEEQAAVSESIATAMGEVGEISSDTAQATQTTSFAMKELTKISDELRESVEIFKVEEADAEVEKEEAKISEEKDVDAAESGDMADEIIEVDAGVEEYKQSA
ncbi:MAG: HAMP domain-containing protein [Deltaproteobacteria bacterium]|nr:HAMP domain-containing protein [Deltaproteobacteria bacterium]